MAYRLHSHKENKMILGKILTRAVLTGLIMHGIQESIKAKKERRADEMVRLALRFNPKCACEQCRKHLAHEHDEKSVYEYVYYHIQRNGLGYFQRFYKGTTIQVVKLEKDYNKYTDS